MKRSFVVVGCAACVAVTANANPPTSKAKPAPVSVAASCSGDHCVADALPSTGRGVLVLHFSDAMPKRLTGQGSVAAKACGAKTLCLAVDFASTIALTADGHAVLLLRPAEPATSVEKSAVLSTWALDLSTAHLTGEPVAIARPTFFNRPTNTLLGPPTPPIAFMIAGGPTPPPPLLAKGIPSVDDVSVADVVAIGGAAGYDCSGVTVGPHYVLTARHCGQAQRVAIGNRVDSPSVEIAVDRVVPAPDASVDAELLHTTAALPVAARPRRSAADTTPPFGEVRVVGFGVDDFHAETGFGVKRQMTVSTQGWGCDHGRPASTGCHPGTEMVLAAGNGEDTCNGDSGGAVLEKLGQSWRLLAITSRGAGDIAACGRGGIYVRADAIASWVDHVIGENP